MVLTPRRSEIWLQLPSGEIVTLLMHEPKMQCIDCKRHSIYWVSMDDVIDVYECRKCGQQQFIGNKPLKLVL